MPYIEHVAVEIMNERGVARLIEFIDRDPQDDGDGNLFNVVREWRGTCSGKGVLHCTVNLQDYFPGLEGRGHITHVDADTFDWYGCGDVKHNGVATPLIVMSCDN